MADEEKQTTSVMIEDCIADFLCKDDRTGICIYITGDVAKIMEIDNVVINFKED